MVTIVSEKTYSCWFSIIQHCKYLNPYLISTCWWQILCLNMTSFKNCGYSGCNCTHYTYANDTPVVRVQWYNNYFYLTLLLPQVLFLVRTFELLLLPEREHRKGGFWNLKRDWLAGFSSHPRVPNDRSGNLIIS